MLSGQGCGDTSTAAPQCIAQSGCTITLVSGTAGQACATAGCALNGTTSIAADGSFSGAAIQEGTGMRTGCTATWNPAVETALTVDCGGKGSSQSCIAILTLTSQTCP